MRALEGKVVVITGASSGLGEAAAWRLAAEGATLALGARRMERLRLLAQELGQDETAAIATDVTRYDDVKRLRRRSGAAARTSPRCHHQQCWHDAALAP